MDVNGMYVEAVEAAKAAGEAVTPRPMIVGQASSLLGRGIVPGTEEFVSEGVCGFAWVVIKPARGPFVTHLKKLGIGHKCYYGGWEISMSKYIMSQSMERKEHAARAFAEVLRKYGLNVYADSRLD